MENRKARGPAAAVAALGMTSLATQVILLREFVSVFQGNELVIGVVLAGWMMLTGTGAFLGRFPRRSSPRRPAAAAALACAGMLPPATVFLLRTSRNIVFTAGSMVGVLQAFCASLVILAPYCLLSGFLFTFFVRLFSAVEGEQGTARVYAWEALGGAAGGAIITLALAPYLETFQTLFLVLLADLCTALFIAREGRSRRMTAAILVLIAGTGAALAMNGADAWTRHFLFPGEEIVYFRDTPYGNLTLTRRGGEISFFENSAILFSTNDVTSSEETVHYCLAQRPAPRRVLLVGGGMSGATAEILKYPVEALDEVELNPWVVRAGRAFAPVPADTRLSIIEGDARMFVRTTPRRYDAAILNVPDPATAQINRFYTLEFFGELRSVLSDSAVVSISLLPAGEYQGTEARRLSSILYATLGRVFRHVLIVPGDKNYFIASDGPLDPRVTRLVEARGIRTEYVNRYYVDDARVAARSRELTSALDTAGAVNRDFTPVCYYRQLAYWLSYFGFMPGPWLLIAGLALLLLLGRFTVVGAALFAGGFAASSLEIILMISFQVLCGSLYQMTAILVTAFMAGLASGTFFAGSASRRGGFGTFIAVQFAVAAICFVLPPVLLLLEGMKSSPFLVECVITGITFGAAVMTGTEFAVASRLRRGSTTPGAAELYGLDLFGSALGALVVSMYAIPLFGLTSVSLVAGAVTAGGGILCFSARRKYT